MHVTIGDADQPGTDTLPTDLHDVRVGPGSFRSATNLNPNVKAFGGRLQSLEHTRVNIRPAEQGRAVSQAGFAKLFFVVAWSIGGMADVDGDTDGRANAIGAGGSA